MTTCCLRTRFAAQRGGPSSLCATATPSGRMRAAAASAMRIISFPSLTPRAAGLGCHQRRKLDYVMLRNWRALSRAGDLNLERGGERERPRAPRAAFAREPFQRVAGLLELH